MFIFGIKNSLYRMDIAILYLFIIFLFAILMNFDFVIVRCLVLAVLQGLNFCWFRIFQAFY